MACRCESSQDFLGPTVAARKEPRRSTAYVVANQQHQQHMQHMQHMQHKSSKREGPAALVPLVVAVAPACQARPRLPRAAGSTFVCCALVRILAVAMLVAQEPAPAVAFGAFAKMRGSNRTMESLKIFVPEGGPFNFSRSKAKARCAESMHVPDARPIKLAKGSSLEPVKAWLHVNNEYIGKEYMNHLVNCHPNLVAEPKDADICWPNCRNYHFFTPDTAWSKQYVHFEVRSKALFPGCSAYIAFSPEFLKPKNPNTPWCSVSVPYFHGVFAPADTWDTAPWDLSLPRDTLLSFFGGVWRRKERWEFHGQATQVASQLQNHTAEVAGLLAASDQPRYRLYYSVPLDSEEVKAVFPEMAVHSQRRKDHIAAMHFMWSSDAMYELAWLTYATSQFCWNPHGDTPTRRAFYDAWMFGCIPVVPESSERDYARLFGGSFFSFHKTTLADIVVVVPDSATAHEVFERLLSLSLKDIEFRQRTIRLLAPFLQWNFHMAKSAIRLFFHALLANDHAT